MANVRPNLTENELQERLEEEEYGPIISAKITSNSNSKICNATVTFGSE